MSFRITGLDPAPFVPLYGLSDADLAARGVERLQVTHAPGYPDRIEMRDAQPGETVLLMNYEHQPAATPYRASHAIYVREGATEAVELVDAVPPALHGRPISLRAFDASGRLIAADLARGSDIADPVARLFDNAQVAYLHAHYATHGCYAARIDRA